MKHEYLTPSEVARIFHVSRTTVGNWAAKGRLPFALTLGGHRRYPKARIEEIARRLAANDHRREPPIGGVD